MMNNIVTGSFSSIEQATGKFGSKRISTNNIGTAGASSFGEILSQKKSIEEAVNESNSSIRFSKHAGERLEQRDIQLSQEQMTRLEEGTQKANNKGIKESLVLLDDMAFIVNTQSRTVITAMYQESGEDNIYTNIDGAVII